MEETIQKTWDEIGNSFDKIRGKPLTMMTPKMPYDNVLILTHGDNMSVMSSINKIKFLAAKTKLDEAEKNYDLLLE